MAFGRTLDSFDSRDAFRAFLDRNGGICDAQTDQETTIYAVSIQRDAIDEAVMLLTETAFRPVVNVESVAEALHNVENDIRYLKFEKIRDKEILELACQAGYRAGWQSIILLLYHILNTLDKSFYLLPSIRGNTIGLPRMVPEDLVEKSNTAEQVQRWADALLQYRKDNYLKKSPAFIGIGVTTEELESAVQNHRHLLETPSWVCCKFYVLNLFW